jgi:hypothetical protein
MARMQYELENRTKRSVLSQVWGGFAMHPDMSAAAKSGKPQMQGMRPTIPANVPPIAAGTLGTSGDITVSVPGDSSALENNPDARSVPPGQAGAAGEAPAQAAATPPSAATPAAAAAPSPAAGAAKNQKKVKTPKPPKAPKKTKATATPPAAAAPAPAPAAGAPPKQ